MQFIGWVPNITGRLSFFALSASHLTSSADSVRIHPTDGSPRFIAALHRRVTNDDASKAIVRGLLPKSVALRVNWKPSDSFLYIFVARANAADDELDGDIYVLKPLPFAQRWADKYAEGSEKLRRTGATDGDISSADCDSIIAEFSNLSASENSTHVIRAHVHLSRDGRCTLDVPDNSPPLWPPPLQCANYAFMFLRDLFHTHYHHADSDDNLVPLCQGSPGIWASETERSLYRSVLGARRLRHPRDIAEAEGRLAYLKAFRLSFGSIIPASSRILEPLNESLDASRAQGDANTEKKAILITLAAAIPFSLFELFVHLGDFVDGGAEGQKPSPDRLKDFMSYLYSNTSQHLAFAVVALFILLGIYGSVSGVADIERWRITKAISRAHTMSIRRGESFWIYFQQFVAMTMIVGGIFLAFRFG